MPKLQPSLEHKSVPVFEIKAPGDDGIIEAIVSVTGNVDSGNEIVEPGFFSGQAKLPKGVWGHNWEMPIAKTLIFEEWKAGDSRLPDEIKDLGGYYVKGQFNLNTQRGKEAYSDVKFGIIDEFSIGYRVTSDAKDKDTGARRLIKGECFEWSPVLVGMNRETQLISVKDAKGAQVTPEKKGMFEAVIAERLESLWTLTDFLMTALYRAQYMDEAAEDAGVTFDLSGTLDEILAEFGSRVKASIMGDDAEEDSTEIEMSSAESLMKFKGLETGLPFEKHSATVESAVQELALRGAAVKSLIGDLVARGKGMHAVRTKEGRSISAANLERLKSTLGKITPAIDSMSEVQGDLSDFISIADSPEKSIKPSMNANQAYAEFLRTEASIVGRI